MPGFNAVSKEHVIPSLTWPNLTAPQISQFMNFRVLKKEEACDIQKKDQWGMEKETRIGWKKS